MDVEMPELDGLGALRELRAARCPAKVIMFSTLTQRGSRAAVEAITSGAVDCVAKPTGVGHLSASIERIRAELVPRHQGDRRPRPDAATGRSAEPERRAEYRRHPHLIVDRRVDRRPRTRCARCCTALPRGASTSPIAMVQHMPATGSRAR
jgi:two-component system chemotaxis response regulator CheB